MVSYERKLSFEERSELRRRRPDEKVAVLAAAFGVSETTVRYHCRHLKWQREPRSHDDPRVLRVVALVAAQLGLANDWAAASRAHRGRPIVPLAVARRAAALALCQLGMAKRAVGRVLFRDQSRVFEALRRAEVDMEAQRVAIAVLMHIEGGAERERAAA